MADKKLYRTATGKHIDFQKLMLENEHVRAVGNMNVNARGDVIDSGNKKVATRSHQVNKTYHKQVGNIAKDLPVASSKKAAQAIAEQYLNVPVNKPKETPVDPLAALKTAIAEKPVAEKPVAEKPVEEKVIEKTPATKKSSDVPAGGLAAAIAKAREVKQEQLPTPRETQRSGDGVKKI